MHPQFKELMNRIFNDFISSRIILITNGKLLPKLNKCDRNRFDRIYITWYKGFNEEEIKEVINEDNVFINRDNFIKIDDSKKLKDAQAKKIFKYCSQKIYRFIGTRLYICCNAESIERMLLKYKIHVDILEDNNWQNTIKNNSHYKACRYCIFANSISNRKRLRCYIDLIKQKILLNSPLAKYDFKIIWQIWRYIKNKRNWYKFQN